MKKYLYEISFNRGRSNPEYETFLCNAIKLNAKVSDFGCINNLCVISHHMDRKTVFEMCADGLKKSSIDLSVVEITKKTLASPNCTHSLFTELITNYFLPHGNYPNIK